IMTTGQLSEAFEPLRILEAQGEQTASRPPQAIDRSAILWLLAIFALGLLLRIAFISKQSLWVDEVASWHIASSLESAITAERTNPPLYYVLLHFWMNAFGTSEAALRSMSMVGGGLVIPVLFGFARRLTSREVALCAAFYQSVSSFQVYYSQEA